MTWLLFTLLSGAETLLLRNGDRLEGTPIGLTDGVLKWESKAFSEVFHAPIEKVRRVEFSTREGGTQKKVCLYMNRGDRIQGELLGVDETHFTINTGWAELSVLKSMVNRMEFLEGVEYLMKEVGKLTEWKKVANRKTWQEVNNGMGIIGRGAMCRKVKTGEAFQASVQLKTDDSPRLRILFLASEGEVYEPESYLEVTIQRYIMVARANYLGEMETVGQLENLHEYLKGGELSLRVFIDKKQRVMGIYLASEKVAEWTLPEELASGDWLYLYSENDGEVEVEEMQILSWNGAFPLSEQKRSEFSPESENPLLILANGDVLDADLLGYANGEILAESGLGEVRVPSRKLNEIDFQKTPYNEARREMDDVLVKLKDGSQVTLALQEWNESEITGYSQQFNAFSIAHSEILSIQFNIYED